MPVEPAVTIDRRDFDAAIFDLDGVLTDTARVHAAAWKAVFDAFLQKRAERQGVVPAVRHCCRLPRLCRWETAL